MQIDKKAAITDEDGFELVIHNKQRRCFILTNSIKQQWEQINCMSDCESDTSSEGNQYVT